MRISMISEHASPLAAVGGVDAGGQNVHVAELASAIARSGPHRVTVYTRRDSPQLPRRVKLAPNVEVVHIDAGPAEHVDRDSMLPFMPALAEGVAADWRRTRPELVHAHFWMSGLAALEASERHEGRTGERVPVVETFHALGTVKRRHQGSADTSPAERAWLEPRVGSEADAIIATCTDEVFELNGMGVDTRKISIAPCGVNLGMFSPAGDVEPRKARNTIAVVGRLVPRKGIEDVIAALAVLQARGETDLELLVVGGPEGGSAELLADAEIARLAAIADHAGVGELVRFRGRVPRDRLGAVLRSVDVVVCTPWYEPFGIVPLEAMACGVPVVASAVGGLIDTVVDGTTGLHVPPHDSVALADALAALLHDDRLRGELGRAGRERVSERYTWERIAETTLEVYRRTLAGAIPARVPALSAVAAIGGRMR